MRIILDWLTLTYPVASLKVPRIWFELRAICTIEILNYILDQLMREGLVQELQDASSNKALDEFYYRITPDPDEEDLQESSEVQVK